MGEARRTFRPTWWTALIATEDHRFYHHHGIDVQRTVSAVLHTASGERAGRLHHHAAAGAQFLSRRDRPLAAASPASSRRPSPRSKIEAIYSKDEILETYLNTVPFLYNAYGIEMAARTYFDKPPPRWTCWKAPR